MRAFLSRLKHKTFQGPRFKVFQGPGWGALFQGPVSCPPWDAPFQALVSCLFHTLFHAPLLGALFHTPVSYLFHNPPVSIRGAYCMLARTHTTRQRMHNLMYGCRPKQRLTILGICCRVFAACGLYCEYTVAFCFVVCFVSLPVAIGQCMGRTMRMLAILLALPVQCGGPTDFRAVSRDRAFRVFDAVCVSRLFQGCFKACFMPGATPATTSPFSCFQACYC